jgi:hypothetical protein
VLQASDYVGGTDFQECFREAKVTVTYLRLYVTGSNDYILGEVGRTRAVSLVGAH